MKQNIKDYWENKDIRAEVAFTHTKIMNESYSKEINYSIDNSIIYDGRDHIFNKVVPSNETSIVVIDEDSVTAVMNSSGKTAVLNFASFKHPGGGFMAGSKAQEECLCHESILYNVISTFEDFYEENRGMLNKALYHNRAIYSKDILFERANGNKVKCDVITCACPNKSAAQKYQRVSEEENYKYLNSRIKFVLNIAAENNVETLILGAYGCGVFGQDPIEVAQVFKVFLDSEFNGVFKKIIFAIPNGKNDNLTGFRKVFMGDKQ